MNAFKRARSFVSFNKGRYYNNGTNQSDQQEKCCAFLSLTQHAHKSLFAKCFELLSFQLLLQCTHYYDIHIIKVTNAIQREQLRKGQKMSNKSEVL